MTTLDQTVVDKIVESCVQVYTKLPKSGKPVAKEWTVLSCLVKLENKQSIEVVSLATGSKCIGSSKLSAQGDILNDSHAEVMARRGFIWYCYDQLDKFLENEKSIFHLQNNRILLKSEIQFVFFSSQLPCGDASIIPKINNNEDIGSVLFTNKRLADDDICNIQSKITKVCEDIHRTGAKCLPGEIQDPKEAGSQYHICGQVRTKPGRGDRTLSVSCSDKMARWVHLGIQGALLEIILHQPIYISSFIFGSGVPYSINSLKRALFNRTKCKFKPPVMPEIYQSCSNFKSIKNDENVRPAPGGMIWIQHNNLLFEVAVQGRKLGATKKSKNLDCNALCISKYNLYKKFLNILTNKNYKNKEFACDLNTNLPYNEMKRQSTKYYERWNILKADFFKTWTIKPDIWNFHIS